MIKALRNILCTISIIIFVIGWSFNTTDYLLLSVGLIFINNIWFAIEKVYDRIIFLMFNLTFLLFLFGRIISSELFKYNPDNSHLFGLAFNNIDIINHILKAEFLSLFFLFVGNLIFLKFNFSKKKDINEININFKIISIRKSSIFLYYIAIIFRFYYLYEMIKTSQTAGYYESFSTFQSQMPGILILLSETFDIAFFIFLSTFPSKKKIKVPVFLYILEGIMNLISGRRSGFVLNILILLIYYVFWKKRWLKNNYENEEKGNFLGSFKKFLLIIVIIPLLIFVLNLVGSNRGQNLFSSNSNSIEFSGEIIEFLYSQGISANVIGYGYKFDEQLPDKLYTIGPITEFINNKIIGHYILGHDEFIGQTVDRALNGYLFSHTISYFIMPDLYLRGVGYGSSYVAELYADFGYLGVILGNILYGILLGFLYKGFNNNNIWKVAIILMITRIILFAPRAGTLLFIVNTFAISKIVGILIIILSSFIIKEAYKKNILHKSLGRNSI